MHENESAGYTKDGQPSLNSKSTTHHMVGLLIISNSMKGQLSYSYT
jgi:hypothetical protein